MRRLKTAAVSPSSATRITTAHGRRGCAAVALDQIRGAGPTVAVDPERVLGGRPNRPAEHLEGNERRLEGKDLGDATGLHLPVGVVLRRGKTGFSPTGAASSVPRGVYSTPFNITVKSIGRGSGFTPHSGGAQHFPRYRGKHVRVIYSSRSGPPCSTPFGPRVKNSSAASMDEETRTCSARCCCLVQIRSLGKGHVGIVLPPIGFDRTVWV